MKASALEEDWLRTMRWDIWHEGRLVTTRAELEASLIGTGFTLAAFLQLPAARPMPAGLRAELEAAGLRPPTTARR